MDNAEILVKGIISKKNNKKEARNMYSAITDKANAIINAPRSSKVENKKR